jgi:putative ABC transport system permease protein
MSLHDRLFRILMRVLPAEFRADYGREMESHFRAERRDAGSAGSLVRLWFATLADIARTAPGEHLDILARDLSYAIRMLARRPALALATVLTLALGIGANTAIFSVVNGVLLAPLPYPAAARIVTIEEAQPDRKPGRTGYYSFDAMRARQQSFDSVAALASWNATFRADGQETERVNGARVTWEYFRTLGLTPALGRDFEATDDTPEHRRIVLLSDGLWRRRFNADPSVIGKPVSINTVTYTVVGVMPRSLNEMVSGQLSRGAELWTPLGYAVAAPQACRTCRHIQMVGRVRDGVAMPQAEADATRVYRSLAQEFPSDYSEPSAVVTPIRERFLGPARPALMLLWIAVGLLLLMACGNIANLLLIRASEREEEVAVRRALGVTPARLLRQFLTESLLLAGIGGVLGTLIAVWATRLLVANGPAGIPRLGEVSVSAPVLLYALASSVATGLIFGMAPARMLLTRAGGANVLAHATRTTSGPAAWRHRAVLVGVNVALSTVLLVASGLLVRSFVSLLNVDPGFDSRNVLTMEVEISGQQYEQIPQISDFYNRLSARLAALPGVAAVGASTSLPLTDSVDQWGITIEGRPQANPADAPEADRYGVEAGYFKAMNIPLLRGRLFTPADGPGAPPVVVIGKTMAEQLWPGEDPIGRRVRLAGGPGNPMRTIVGVVGDVRHSGLHLPVSYQAYMPQSQSPWGQNALTMVIKARDGQDAAALTAAAREQVRALDASQPIIRVRTYESIIATLMGTRRFTLVLLAAFAATALLLAIVGLYGALSYVVTQRQREIGVRVALGADGRDIRRLVIAQGMRPVVIGIAGGVAGAALAGQLLASMLYGVTAGDPASYGMALVAMVGCAALACVLPARKATQVEPAATLRG